MHKELLCWFPSILDFNPRKQYLNSFSAAIPSGPKELHENAHRNSWNSSVEIVRTDPSFMHFPIVSTRFWGSSVRMDLGSLANQDDDASMVLRICGM
jgi:hypothetical protein